MQHNPQQTNNNTDNTITSWTDTKTQVWIKITLTYQRKKERKKDTLMSFWAEKFTLRCSIRKLSKRLDGERDAEAWSRCRRSRGKRRRIQFSDPFLENLRVYFWIANWRIWTFEGSFSVGKVGAKGRVGIWFNFLHVSVERVATPEIR